MTPAQKSKGSTLEVILTFVVLFFVTNWALQYFFPAQFGKKPAPIVTMTMQDASLGEGSDPVVRIANHTDKDMPLPARCPQPPVDIAFLQPGQTGSGAFVDRMANQTAIPCEELTLVAAGETANVNLAAWKYSLLNEKGTYQVNLDLPSGFVGEGSGSHLSTQFTIGEAGFFTKLFRTFISKPLFNALIFIASYTPGHNLGVAIILLTILVRVILLVPNQHALEGQRKLQLLQPKLEELKKKYPGDSKKQQEETMKLWKEYNINPLQSCLPTLLQFPILIGLYYVVQGGSAIATSKHLMYSFYQDLPATFFGTQFLWVNLLKPEVYIMPISLVVLQYIQMKMMFAKSKKVDDKKVITIPAKKSWMPEMNQQTIMLYALPLMIGFFAFQFPAAVALYWGVSTLFGIGQQWYVMREKVKV